jgi:hypothetical protein
MREENTCFYMDKDIAIKIKLSIVSQEFLSEILILTKAEKHFILPIS